MPTPSTVDKRYDIERLKSLRATTFKGTTSPANEKKWLSLVEKCFGVMECTKERRAKLATFLLQRGVEDWWTLHVVRVKGMGLVSWEEFRKAFQNKFYPHYFCDTKRNEFIILVQDDTTVAEYPKKFTKLTS